MAFYSKTKINKKETVLKIIFFVRKILFLDIKVLFIYIFEIFLTQFPFKLFIPLVIYLVLALSLSFCLLIIITF